MAKINLRNKLREKSNDDNSNDLVNNVEVVNNTENDNNILNNQVTVNRINNNSVKEIEINQEIEEESNKNNNRLNRINKHSDKKAIYPVEEDEIFKKQTNKSIFDSNNDKKNNKENILDKLNINKKMFFIAIGMALVASILVINYLNGLSAEKLYNSEIVNVLVAKKEIPEKKVITKDDLAKLEIPKKFVLKDAIILNNPDAYKEYIGKIALTTIYPNEQLLSKRFVSEKESPWVSPIVPINHRAININSKSLSYIKPSDHVDIIVSIYDPKNKNKKINTPILQNVLVLAVDGKWKVSSEDSFTSGNVITLAIPNNLVNLFSILQDRAEFQLALRRDDDNTVLESKYSLKDIEKIFTENNDIKPIKNIVEKPIIIERKPIVIQQPVRQPVYQAPVYREPVVNKPKPIVTKQVQPKKEVKVENPNPPQVKTTTVTVINGTNIKQQNVPKDKENN